MQSKNSTLADPVGFFSIVYEWLVGKKNQIKYQADHEVISNPSILGYWELSVNLKLPLGTD